MDKETKKFFRETFGWFFLHIFTLLNGFLPLKLNYFLGTIFGSLAYCFAIRQRRIALESLSIAFPKLSIKEKKKITLQFFIFMVQSSFELIYFLRNSTALKNIKLDGKEYLNQALSKKRGVILLTAHFGNFPLMSLKLAKEGFKVNFVTRPMRDEKIGDYLYKLRTKAGVKTIFSYPRRECVIEIIRALKDNQIVIMQMDQNFGSAGVWVKFFGKLAATPTGPIILALRTSAEIVPAYIYRENFGKHVIKIFPAQQLLIKENKDETILLNVARFTRMFEDWICNFPYQWGWIHRRWKSRPSKAVENLKFKIEKD